MKAEQLFAKLGYEYCCLNEDSIEYIRKDCKGIKIYNNGAVEVIGLCGKGIYLALSLSLGEIQAINQQLKELNCKMEDEGSAMTAKEMFENIGFSLTSTESDCCTYGRDNDVIEIFKDLSYYAYRSVPYEGDVPLSIDKDMHDAICEQLKEFEKGTL